MVLIIVIILNAVHPRQYRLRLNGSCKLLASGYSSYVKAIFVKICIMLDFRAWFFPSLFYMSQGIDRPCCVIFELPDLQIKVYCYYIRIVVAVVAMRLVPRSF